jgi:integrase
VFVSNRGTRLDVGRVHRVFYALSAAQTQRVLAIPAKRFTRALVSFLSRQEVDALLAAPDQLGGAITPSFYSRCRPGCVCRS